jgi:2-dehydro-3-deoxy-D-arabinonate dehydratase
MQIAKFQSSDGPRVGRVDGDQLRPLSASATLFEIFEADDPQTAIETALNSTDAAIALADAQLLAPIDQHEVWAAGVTYIRSKTARMEESEAAADCYDRIYVADRPELFFKALPHRVSGSGQPVRIRQDSNWNVPEPELGLVLNTRLEIVGFIVGNDMSSRDIEGDNPLYLPQAKVYNQCCGLGPWITLAPAMPSPAEIGIQLTVRRGESVAFEGETNAGQMARSFEDLVSWLGRDNTFPTGAVLLTGTGIVPDEFTLEPEDVVDITIDGIGTLSNPVVQGA